jgi:hypothetical protein
VAFLKGMDYAMSRVVEFTTNGLPVLQGAVSVVPGMAVTDDSAKTFWRFGPTASGENLVLVDGPEPRDALRPGDALRAWEIGPGDPYRLPVQVNVMRRDDGSLSVTRNAKATVVKDP